MGSPTGLRSFPSLNRLRIRPEVTTPGTDPDTVGIVVRVERHPVRFLDLGCPRPVLSTDENLLGFQVLVNVFMTMGLLPCTGLPLPFFSYGGSSLVVVMWCVGMVQNVHMRRYMFR